MFTASARDRLGDHEIVAFSRESEPEGELIKPASNDAQRLKRGKALAKAQLEHGQSCRETLILPDSLSGTLQ
jgi:hypothetical protein